MNFFATQNPGIGGLDELTDAETLFVQGLASLPYSNGDILYYNSGLKRLPKGSDGQFLSLASGIPAWSSVGGGGDMVLASAQTNSGAKTFLDSTLLLRNVANTFSSKFTNTATAARTWTLKDADGTIAFLSDITGTNSGTNTGDQTSIVGITGTMAQFDTAVTDGNFVYQGQALGTPSSGTVTNLTGTASININGTVGATTPTTGVFTTVTTTGNIELGNASDTTLARVAAGIISVEGEVMNGYATTATAAGTTTLTITSAKTQYFTGTSTQTVKLPTTSVILGQSYIISNQSTGSVTVQSSGANTIQILGAGMTATFVANTATPTTAAHWNYSMIEYVGLNNAITASSNAATINLAYKINTVTNNSAATLTITLPTAGAIDGEMRVVRVLDFSAVAQTITWVNTENSTVTAPTTSNGSTTLPLTIGFQYNNATSKWRCIASA